MNSQSNITVKPASATSLSLPSERLTQLRALAEVRHTNLVGLMEGIIARAIEDGEISDAIEGFSVIDDDDTVFMTMRGVALPPIPKRQVMKIVTVLEIAAGKTEVLRLDAGGAKCQFGEGEQTSTLVVGRHGRGVVFAIHSAQTEEITKFASTPTIVGDFAAMIRREIGVEPYYLD